MDSNEWFHHSEAEIALLAQQRYDAWLHRQMDLGHHGSERAQQMKQEAMAHARRRTIKRLNQQTALLWIVTSMAAQQNRSSKAEIPQDVPPHE